MGKGKRRDLLSLSIVHANEQSFMHRSYYAQALLNSLLNRLSCEGDSPRRVGILYDIGCTMEKGIIKVQKCTSSLKSP